MPTRTITSRVDLETERQNFLLYEQRIIQERNEILLNMRNHLDQLDGAARGAVAGLAVNQQSVRRLHRITRPLCIGAAGPARCSCAGGLMTSEI